MQFRAGVVAVVTNSRGQIMAFERSDVPGAWQLPQGGINVGEDVGDAAWRELFEETGLGPDQVELSTSIPSGPPTNGRPRCASRPARVAAAGHASGRRSDGSSSGPLRRWSNRSRTGSSSAHGDGSIADWLIEQVVEFRRPSYRRVLSGI